MIRLAVVLLACGCGRLAFDPRHDASDLDDTQPDVVPADTADTSCWAAWKRGTPVLTAPMLVSELATAVNDHDFVISPDNLTAYFVSNRTGGPGQDDVWMATRTSPTSPFAVQGPVATLSSPGVEGVFYLLPDRLTGYLTSDRVTAGQHDIFRATRPTIGSPFTLDQVGLAAVNTVEDDFDVFPTPDGLGLYFGTFTGAGLDIVVARRADTSQPFGAPVPVAGVNSAMTDTDPTLSPDELVIAFTSTRGGVTRDMYFATRTSTAAPFDPPEPIPGGNSPDTDQDTVFAADGCELWFASTRAGGTGDDIYVMRVIP